MQIILTGERVAGKTTFCEKLLEEALRTGMTRTGIITKTERDKKLSIRDLYTNDTKELAVINPDFFKKGSRSSQKSPLKTGRWIFHKEALAWGNHRIKQSPPSDLFILDEAGILEFEREDGWTEGIRRIDCMIDRLALIVVRPELTAIALARWKDAILISLNPSHRDNIQDQIRQILQAIKSE